MKGDYIMSMLNKKTIEDINVNGKKVLVRCDFNVPLQDGKITDENRLNGALPTIKYLIEKGAKVILCSHMGKPKGEPKKELSLAPVAARLSEMLGKEVVFADDDNVVGENARAAVEKMQNGDVVLLQNTRYRKEETKNEENFSKELASLADVYVNDATTAGDTGEVKALTIAGYVLHSNADDNPDVAAGKDAGSTGSYVGTKSQGFTNSYDTSDLTFRKEVTGNQASHDKYFEFTVNIAKAVAGTVYDVDITDADATSGKNAATITENEGKANVTSLTVGADGTVTQKFYLQHGQEIKIQGLAKDTTYDVTENKEDYKSTPAGVTDYADPVNGTIVSTDLKTSYMNTRDGVIPTGVVMAVAPFAAVTLFGGAGVVTMAMKGKKRKDEEE